MKKLFLLFCFLQVTTFVFCKHVILDLKVLIQNDTKLSLSKEIEKIIKGNACFVASEIYGQVPGFNLDACALDLVADYNNTINHLRLFDACSQKSQELWGRDFIKEFFTGKITANEILEFVQMHRNDIYSMVSEDPNVFLGPLDKKALDLVAGMLFSNNINVSFYGSNLYYLNFMQENLQSSWILKHLKDAKQDVYLIYNMPAEWYEAYKIKFNNIFNKFSEDHITCSFQVRFKKNEKEFLEAFLKKHKLKANDCILVSDSETNLEEAMYLGFKTILFDFKNPQSVIVALKHEGILDPLLRYFIP